MFNQVVVLSVVSVYISLFLKGREKENEEREDQSKNYQRQGKNDATFLLGLFSLTETNIASH